MTYDQWKADEGPEPEDRYASDDDAPECIHGFDLLARCEECEAIKLSAADGGEGDDDYMERSQESFVSNQTTLELVSLRNAIEIELKRRKDDLAKDLQAVEHALNGTKPRARRSDAGRPRAPKEAPPARLEHGELNPAAVDHAVRSATERVLREKGVAV